MKKILFLSPAYPFGHTGPSNNCTVRVMDALVRTGRYVVYNISYAPSRVDDQPNHKIVEGVKTIQLPYKEPLKAHSRAYQRIVAFLRIPVYPLGLPIIRSIWKNYKYCKDILRGDHFDLLVSQFNPFDSVICGALLKKNRYINKHLVLAWDVIYGKRHHPIIPKKFALTRQLKTVNWIARYSDKLITIYSQESFHKQFGDAPEAEGKRIYLGIPTITRLNQVGHSVISNFTQKDKINFVYAGSIYSEKDLEYAINLLNASSFAEQANLILLVKDPSLPSIKKMLSDFKGSVQLSGWISSEALYDLYSQVDIFLAFSGKWAWGVPGKNYEYMCFGKPIIHFYEYDNDANLSIFAPYPLFKAIDIKDSIDVNRIVLDKFLNSSNDIRVSYDEVERLFPYATLSAYIKVIDQMVE